MTFVDKLNICHLNNIRKTDSHEWRSLAKRSWCKSICKKPMLPCIFDCLPPQQNFLPTRHKIANQGASIFSIVVQQSNSERCWRASAAATKVFCLLILVLKKEFLWVNRGWPTKTWTNATTPFTFFWSIATASRDTVKMRCESGRPSPQVLSSERPEKSICGKPWEHQDYPEKPWY